MPAKNVKRAIVSDIHGNWEALSAVLEHARSQAVDAIYCLGDVVGYGPNPRECLEVAIREFDECILGNHESAVLFHADDFNEKARQALDWTRDQFNASDSPEDNNRLWIYLDQLKDQSPLDGALLVHGSPRDPVREYILPRDIKDEPKMKDIFSRFHQPICFIGHSHVPGVYTDDGRYFAPDRLPGGVFPSYPGQVLVNVGSVGQPRDGDPRSSYVIWEDDRLTFYRIEYDYQTTMNKILETGTLPRYLADRLSKGR